MRVVDSKITARILDRSARDRAAQREAARVEVLRSLRAAVAEARLAHGRVWVIGSVAWGGFFPASDVDLVVDGLEADEITRLERGVRDATGRVIDLLVFAELPESFRARVTADGVLLHGT